MLSWLLAVSCCALAVRWRRRHGCTPQSHGHLGWWRKAEPLRCVADSVGGILPWRRRARGTNARLVAVLLNDRVQNARGLLDDFLRAHFPATRRMRLQCEYDAARSAQVGAGPLRIHVGGQLPRAARCQPRTSSFQTHPRTAHLQTPLMLPEESAMKNRGQTRRAASRVGATPVKHLTACRRLRCSRPLVLSAV